MFRYLPEQASDFAESVDNLNNIVTDLSVFFTVAIVGAMIFFAIRYRRRGNSDHETPHIEGSILLETIWTVVPTVVCAILLVYAIVAYNKLRNVPEGAEIINVVGQKWKWDFEYKNGKRTTGELVVPVNEPVKLVLSSLDVLHSFFVPAMRVKNDAIPGQYTYVWFRPIKTGEYQVFCTEYCGTWHSNMLAKLRVVSKAEYERWLNDQSEARRAAMMNPVDLGKKLYTEKGCNACHTLNGTVIIGPSFLKLYGKEEKLADGRTIKVEENYLKNSILNPQAETVAGYEAKANLMPSFQGQLTDQQIDGLISFIRSVKDAAPAEAPKPAPQQQEAPKDPSTMTPVERGKALYTAKVCNTCHSLDGSKIIGPTFKGLYGRQEKLVDGSTVPADDAYIKESILNPQAKVVEGYPPAMPPYQGQMSDQEISDMVEFLKTVK